MKQRWMRRWRWPARLAAAGLSVLAIGLVLRRLDLGTLVQTFRGIRMTWLAGAVAVFGAGLLGSALRWHQMLRLNHEAVVHAAASVRMVFISQFFNLLLGGPGAGDLAKTAVYSRWFGVPVADVLAASVLDRVLASFGGILFAMGAVGMGAWVGAFSFLKAVHPHGPGGGVLAGVGGVGALGVALAVLAWHRPQSFAGRALHSMMSSVRLLGMSPRRALQALACAVATAFLFNVTQLLCLQAVSSRPIPWMHLLWAYHLVTMVASLPVTVAGVGVREGAAMVLLGPYGIPPSEAVAAAMLTLVVQLAWAAAGGILLAREQRWRGAVLRRPVPRSISVVIPALNEATTLPATVERLRAIPEIREVLVVDGGSEDGTGTVAAHLGCRVLAAPRGRGGQLRAGAAAATSDVILMVHADTWLPSEAGGALLRSLRDPLVVGGGFWKQFRRPHWMMRGSRLRCWLRLWWGARVLGDQALYVRRDCLEAVGGVPDQPLMEEVELCRRLRRVGRLALAGAAVTTSERRFEKHGVLRTYWLMWRVTHGYRRGVPVEELVRRYERG